jgi:hypothetical protein
MVVASSAVVPCFGVAARDLQGGVAAFHDVAAGAAVHVQVDEAGQAAAVRRARAPVSR